MRKFFTIIAAALLFVSCSSPEAKLDSYFKALQKQLPMKIEQDLTLTEAYKDGNTCVQVLRYTDITKDQVEDSDRYAQILKTKFLSELGTLRETDPMLKVALPIKKTIKYIYKDLNGDEIFTIDITPDDYSN